MKKLSAWAATRARLAPVATSYRLPYSSEISSRAKPVKTIVLPTAATNRSTKAWVDAPRNRTGSSGQASTNMVRAGTATAAPIDPSRSENL